MSVLFVWKATLTPKGARILLTVSEIPCVYRGITTGPRFTRLSAEVVRVRTELFFITPFE